MCVQRQLGHAEISTTERYYGHLERHVLAAGAVATEEAIARAGRVPDCDPAELLSAAISWLAGDAGQPLAHAGSSSLRPTMPISHPLQPVRCVHQTLRFGRF